MSSELQLTTLRSKRGRTYQVEPSPKVLTALAECKKAIGRDNERQRINYMYLKERFQMATDEGLTHHQIAKYVGCSQHHVMRTLTWDPAKGNTPYAGDYAKRATRGGGQYLDQVKVVFGKITTGRLKLDLDTWTAATGLVELDASKLSEPQRRAAVKAALALISRLETFN